MKFLIDAQLPALLARFLDVAGHDALHTSALPEGNRTTDERIELGPEALVMHRRQGGRSTR